MPATKTSLKHQERFQFLLIKVNIQEARMLENRSDQVLGTFR